MFLAGEMWNGMKNLWQHLKTGDIEGLLNMLAEELNPLNNIKLAIELGEAFVAVCKDGFNTDADQAMEIQMDKIDADYEMGTCLVS